MDSVDLLHHLHPDWCTKEIAIHLGKSWGAVRAAYRRLQNYGRIRVLPSTVERSREVPGLREAKPKP